MPGSLTTEIGQPARHLRVATMMGLRWLAISGQCAAVLVTYFGLGFELPFGWCLLIIGISAILNLTLRLWFPLTHRFDDVPAAALFAYDIIQLSLLLYLTGGLSNPFSMLFLAPMMIAAASLSPQRTLLLGLLTMVAATFLMVHHLPLPWFAGKEHEVPPVMSVGTWMAVVLGASFTGIYASRVAEEARQLSRALTATELVLAREQHLTQLDGLAAAAAHELGTPLATITLVVKELIQHAAKEPPALDAKMIRDDLALLDQEIGRCRTILGKLTSLNDEQNGPLQHMTLSHLMEEVIGPQRHFGVSLTVTRHGVDEEPVCARNPGMLYGLGNIVENAIDYANGNVHIDTHWSRDTVSVAITDDGPGFSPDIISRLGEPYLTSKNQGRRSKSEEGAGLGLGLFIAKTLLERSGAKVKLANVPAPAVGAVVTIMWPRSAFERDVVQVKPRAAESRRAAFESVQGL